jgi:hypothetical protein
VPEQEATVYHIVQVRQIIAACNPKLPQEELAVRILVGAGLRESELCGLALVGSDGLPDLMLDSVQRGRVELRVRWDAGAKGKKVAAGADHAEAGGGDQAVRGAAAAGRASCQLLINH